MARPVSAPLVDWLEAQSKAFWAVIGLLLMAAVGLLDSLTGYEISLSLFYLVPIGLVAWYAGRPLGVSASIAGGLVWMLADLAAGHNYSQNLAFVWNAGIRLGFFLIVALLLARLRELLQDAQWRSRTDFLTGAASAGHFYSLLQAEIDRFGREARPFALACADVDDFKRINDTLGHSAGDRVLRSVIACIQARLRKGDVVARLGGDEIAILLLDADQDATTTAILRIQQQVAADLRGLSGPITLSIGAVTFTAAPATPDEAMKQADELMYEVKRRGKNGLRCAVFGS